MAIMRRFGPKSANHAIAVSVFVSFLLVGFWHGTGTNFIVFGALQGAGLVAVHYYAIWLGKILGKERLAAYRKSTPIRAITTLMTFAYFSLTLFFLANNWEQIRVIRDSLQ